MSDVQKDTFMGPESQPYKIVVQQLKNHFLHPKALAFMYLQKAGVFGTCERPS